MLFYFIDKIYGNLFHFGRLAGNLYSVLIICKWRGIGRTFHPRGGPKYEVFSFSFNIVSGPSLSLLIPIRSGKKPKWLYIKRYNLLVGGICTSIYAGGRI